MGTLTTTKPMKFFDISKELQAYEALLTENAIENEGEISPVIEEWEKEFFGALANKTDNTAQFIRTIENEALKMRAEKDFFARKQKSLENLASKIKKFLVGFMQYENRPTLEGELYKIKLTNNGGLQPLVIHAGFDIDTMIQNGTLPERFIKRTPSLDEKALREALANGEEIPFATIAPRGQHVRIS
jgi:hypothetical protein